ncbi:SDR family NAD(P)-dependent oxidoreductase [Aeromicrobium yanjiei]|uniref:Glucose 1-dehydrogenase n=1 Tax=Aeromicrobium yanjiei TaxID=2662028 RepID=A0A5Q2MKH1_9ACTN|nr:SDR family oxidoreductase [Aeromicrobium yanjiei]QGG41532.1 glucose 1-dehydrogenase [Aeromicrobium yanjiei]
MSVAKMSLEGKAAIVTGGGGGIGRAIVLALAEAGADVTIADVSPERCDEVAERVAEIGAQALALPTDVMDVRQIESMVAATDERFGRIDILVNNAGGVSGRPFLEQSERSWRRHIDINLVSMMAGISAAAPVMIRGGRGGSIINVTSIEGSRAAPNFAVYGACKAGMIAFTRSMALELSEHGIRVNAIAPDHTITPGNMGNRTGPVDESTWIERSPETVDAMNRLIPLDREGRAEECGDAALFLASDMASYVTGTVLPVDGGTWASSGWVRGRDRKWTLNEGLSFG